ncbi:MAG: hypothetical protein ABI910_11805 [Gemmatimonadota bacterium]
MENRSMSFGITGIGLVVALVALAFRGTPSPATQVAVGPAAAVTAIREADQEFANPDSAIAGYDRGRRLISEYLGGAWGTITASRDSTIRARLPLRVTLVTIPDPYDSHMDWSYDANLEALRRAMGTAGYVPQSFWLPMRADSVRVVTNRVVVRYPAHDYQPGVFLFRSTNVDAPALHVVYLIPEVPTSGVHIQAFRAALAERRAIMLEGAGIFAVDAREKAELSVLGPNFSGSAMSLRSVIDAALLARGTVATSEVDPRTARLMSGSATSFQNLHVLTDSACVVVRRREGRTGDSVRVARIRFAATVNPDEAMDDVLRDLIDSLHVRPYQVAVLTESGTAYGAARPSGQVSTSGGGTPRMGPSCSDREDVAQAPPLPAVRAATRQAGVTKREPVSAAANASAVSQYLTVPYPLNIASLRSEFERSPSALGTSPGIPSLTDAPRTRLSLDEISRSRESPALTSSLSTPSLDVVLEGLIRTLNEHDVRVVVIKATDVRDKLMLAREVRRGVRDVVLVVYEAHVLLRRPEYADALRGALVLSSYPMALENQFWTTAHRRATSDSSYVRLRDLLAFPTDAALGTYNAALSLLGLPQLRVEFDLHNAFASDSTYHLPPIWLSVVGRDGFYPLRAAVPSPAWRAYLGPPTISIASDSSMGERVHEHSYTHDDLSLSIIIVVPALLIAAMLAMFLTGREGLNRIGLVLPASLSRPASATESLYLALFVLSLSATYLPFSVAIDARRIVASVDAYSGGPSVAMWIVLLLFLVVVLTGVALLANAFHGLIWGRTSKVAGAWSTAEMPAMGLPPSPQLLADGAAADPSRTIRMKLDDFFAPMRAEARVTGRVASVPAPDDLDEYLQQTTRLESRVVARMGIATITLASALFIVASLAYTWHLLSFSFSGGIEATLSMYRALHLASGVSPLLPLVLLGGGFAIWTWWQLQQARKFNHPDHFESGLRHLAHRADAPALWRRAYRAMIDARRGLSWMAPGLGVTWILLAIGTTAWFVLRRRLPSLEVVADTASAGDRWFDAALWLGLFSLLVSTSWAIYRLVHTWNGLERFLDILTGTPLASAFARLPLDVVRLTNVGFLGFRRDDRYDDRYAMELWTRARGDAQAGAADAGTDALGISIAAQLARIRVEARGTDSVQWALDVLRGAWELARTRPDSVKDVPIEVPGLTAPQARALRSLEEYVACEIVLYIEQYLLNLRRLCFFLFASLLILVVVGSQYPYQPHSVISLASILLLGFTVVSVFFVMIRMSRNVALSRISRTEPGKVTWDTTFILNMVTFGIVPLLALATSEFPSVRAFLFSWADPLVRAVART